MPGDADIAFMTQAMRLAENGRYTAHPNPVVGCVIVSDGEVVGAGWHEVAGSAHAEINDSVSDLAKTVSKGVSGTHKRIDKIMWASVTVLVSIAGGLLITISWLLKNGLPWQ